VNQRPGSGMTRAGDTDAVVERILRTYPAITVVGASNAPAKAAHYVPEHMQRHGWRIVPVNPTSSQVLGETAYPAIADVPFQVGLVNVFRPSAATPDIARQAVAAGATALWLQLGIASAESRQIARSAGLLYVEDRCMLVEQRRLGLAAPAT
jgi:predicted CoA-binding protein